MPELAVQSFRTRLINSTGRRPGQARVVDFSSPSYSPLSNVEIVGRINITLGQNNPIRYGRRRGDTQTPLLSRVLADVFVDTKSENNNLYIGIRYPAFPICHKDDFIGYWMHDLRAESGYISFAKIINNDGVFVCDEVFEGSPSLSCHSTELEDRSSLDYWMSRFLKLHAYVEGKKRVIRAQKNNLNDIDLISGAGQDGRILADVDFSDPHYLVWGIDGFSGGKISSVRLRHEDGAFLPIRMVRYKERFSQLAKAEAMKALSLVKGREGDSSLEGERRILEAISFQGLRAI